VHLGAKLKGLTGVKSNPRLIKLANLIASRVEQDLSKTLWFIGPRAYSLKLIKVVLTLTFITVLISLVLYGFFKNPLFFLIILSPLMILLAGIYAPKVASLERKAAIEAELPLFSVLASVMSVSGLSLIRSFDTVSETKLFPAISKEAMLIRRNSLYFNRSPLEALEEVARNHPSEIFRLWILGYSSVLRSGGDVASYLASKAKDFLRSVERKWMGYANTTNVLGEAILALFLLTPMALSLMALVFVGEVSLWLSDLYNFLVVPSSALLASLFVHLSQPKTFDRYDLEPWIPPSLIMGTCSLIPSLTLLRLELYEALLLSLMVLSFPLAYASTKRLRACNQAEKVLPDFLRDVTEHRKLGFDVKEAVVRLSYRRYNQHFDHLLSQIRRALSYGASFKEAVLSVKTPSWTTRVTLLIIEQVAESGGGSPVVLETLANYIGDYYGAKVAGKSGVKLQAYIGYGAPAFMVMGMLLLKSLGEQFSSAITSPQLASFFAGYQLFSQVLSSIMVTIVVSSFIIGVIVAKVSDLTFLSFKHPLICLSSAAISIKVTPLLI